MEWTLDNGLKIVTVVFSALTVVIGTNQWTTMRYRNKLKADLEILKLYETDNPNGVCGENIRQKVERSMLRLYPLHSEERTDLDKSALFVGTLLGALAAISWAYAKKQTSGENWLYVAALACGVVSGVMIYKGFERKFRAWRQRGQRAQMKVSI